jgi:hypothetical protein
LVLALVEQILSTAEARARIARIKDHLQTLWSELWDFHERQGWLALGYTSFKECVEQELGLSERRAYQLLDAARIRAELDTEPGFSIVHATERQLRELKPLSLEQRVEVALAVDFNNTTVRELHEIVQQKLKQPEGAKQSHVAHNSGNNEWYTPPEYIVAACRVMGGIDLDPASSPIANRIVGASQYFTAEDDGLAQPWAGRVWMNPPYAAELVGKFTEKMAKHFLDGDVSEAIVLVNNATETNWFQTLLVCASAVCFVKQRVKFLDPEGNPRGAPLQGQALLYLGRNPDTFAEQFTSFGVVLYGTRARRNSQ